jgi:hypothetical protein
VGIKNRLVMKKSEQYEMALLAEKALEKAHQKYDDVI